MNRRSFFKLVPGLLALPALLSAVEDTALDQEIRNRQHEAIKKLYENSESPLLALQKKLGKRVIGKPEWMNYEKAEYLCHRRY